MKKFIITILSIVMLFCFGAGLVACGDGEPITLQTPTLTATGATLNWNTIDNAKNYTLRINGKDEVVEGNSYTFVNAKAGEYSCSVKANGDGEQYLTSVFSNPVTIVIEYDAPVITAQDEIFVPQSSTFTLSETSLGLTIEEESSYELVYSVKYNGETPVTLTDNSFTTAEYGYYEVKVTATDFFGVKGEKVVKLLIEGTAYVNNLNDEEINTWVSNSFINNVKNGIAVREKVTLNNGDVAFRFDMKANERIVFSIPLTGRENSVGEEFFAYFDVFSNYEFTTGALVISDGNGSGGLSGTIAQLDANANALLVKGEYVAPASDTNRIAALIFDNTTGEDLSFYISMVMLTYKPTWQERSVDVYNGSDEVTEDGDFVTVMTKDDAALNVYLTENEPFFAGEKVKVTMNYKITSNEFCMGARGAMIVHNNGNATNLENGETITFETYVTTQVGAFVSTKAVHYGPDAAHLALAFLIKTDATLVIKSFVIEPVKANTLCADSADNAVKDFKTHYVDLGLNGNTLYMLPSVTGMQTLSAVITNTAGDVFLIDGGFDKSYGKDDAEKIYYFVKNVCGKDTIKGWFFTHPHNDHFTVFHEFMDKYNQEITVEKVYYSWSDEESWYTERKSFEHGDAKWSEISNFKNAIETYNIATEHPVTGDIYNFGSFTFEILYSPKNTTASNGGTVGDFGFDLSNYGYGTDSFRYNVNDLSLVIKMDNGSGKSVLFLGDAGPELGEWLYATYADTTKLKADFVQMAHHGQLAVEKNVYDLVQPKYALFNMDYANWIKQGYRNTSTYREWIKSLGATAYYSQLGQGTVIGEHVVGDNLVFVFN